MIKHMIDVAKLCQEEDRALALLHDVVEDTDITLSHIRLSFGREIAYQVDLLTRRKSETYFDYIHRIKHSESKTAIRVKLADLADHLSKKETLKPSLEKRYLKAWEVLYEDI